MRQTSLTISSSKSAYVPLLTTLEGVVNVRTVESDVMAALGGRTCVAAGRTDKDVSALSQVRLAGHNGSIHATDSVIPL
jgi:hypothetical protein